MSNSIIQVLRAFFLLLIFVPSIQAERLLRPEFKAHPLLAKRIEGWIANLKKQSGNEASVKEIVQTGTIAAPYLIEALETSNDILVKKQLMEILATLKVQASIPALVKLLSNEKENPRVREPAAMALGSLSSSEETLTVLSKYSFDQDARIHRASAYSLCRIQTRNAIPHLIALLKHWDETIRYKAHSSLTKITGITLPSDFSTWQKWWSDYKDIFEEME